MAPELPQVIVGMLGMDGAASMPPDRET